MRLPSPGTTARKSSPEAVFKLALVMLAESADWLDDELLPLVVVEDVDVGAAVAHAVSTIMQSNSSEIKVDFRFILFSNS